MKGRTMYVVPFLWGRSAPIIAQHRRPDHRLAVRRREHEDHDAMGKGALDVMATRATW